MTTTPHPARLDPVPRSWNPLVWLMAAVYRTTTGHVGPAVRVIFSRVPKLIFGHLMLMSAAEYLTSLDRRTRTLVRVFGSRANNCMFCDDLESYMALRHKSLTREEIDAVPHYANSDHFNARERAALRYIEDVNTTRVASDETFAALREHFSEKEIVEITWINAVNNYLNLMAKPLGIGSQGYCPLPAGSSAGAGDGGGDTKQGRTNVWA